MSGALLLFIISPFISGWWLPKDISTFGGNIDMLFYVILAITGFFFVLTEAILVYAMYRYASQPGRKASYVHGNHTLELVWTVIPGVILLLLAVVQINVWAEVKFEQNMPEPDARPIDDPKTKTGAKQWVEIGYDPATGKTEDLNMIWELACAEFCGARHSLMRGKLFVHENEPDFLDWLKQTEAAQNRH